MITIWPQYLDKNLTLSEGRKISKEYAVSSPTTKTVVAILMFEKSKLGKLKN